MNTIPFSDVPVGATFYPGELSHRRIQKLEFVCVTENLDMCLIRDDVPCIVIDESEPTSP
jgi:hypothetical protein